MPRSNTKKSIEKYKFECQYFRAFSLSRQINDWKMTFYLSNYLGTLFYWHFKSSVKKLCVKKLECIICAVEKNPNDSKHT